MTKIDPKSKLMLLIIIKLIPLLYLLLISICNIITLFIYDPERMDPEGSSTMALVPGCFFALFYLVSSVFDFSYYRNNRKPLTRLDKINIGTYTIFLLWLCTTLLALWVVF